MGEFIQRGIHEGRLVAGEECVADGFGPQPTDGIVINMENTGFDGRERSEEFPMGWWILGFAVGDIAWWLAWMIIIGKLGYDDLFGATFIGTTVLYKTLYTPGIRLLAALIGWMPFVLTAGIAYRFKFGNRSGWPILVWFGAAYMLCLLTRIFAITFFAFA